VLGTRPQAMHMHLIIQEMEEIPSGSYQWCVSMPSIEKLGRGSGVMRPPARLRPGTWTTWVYAMGLHGGSESP
jgi:hypothetical protein